jgi:hypothetical protein
MMADWGTRRVVERTCLRSSKYAFTCSMSLGGSSSRRSASCLAIIPQVAVWWCGVVCGVWWSRSM